VRWGGLFGNTLCCLLSYSELRGWREGMDCHHDEWQKTACHVGDGLDALHIAIPDELIDIEWIVPRRARRERLLRWHR